MTALNQSPFLYALGWAIAGSLWQMALLWIIYQVCFNTHRKVQPWLKHLASTSFLMIGFIWFCIALVQKYVEQNALQQYIALMPVSDSPIATDGTTISLGALGWNTLTELADQYLPYISAAYLLVLAFLAVRLVNAFLYSQKLKTTGLLEIGGDWIDMVESFGKKIGISRKIKIYLSEWIDVPATIGYLKPIVLLPVATFNHLTVQQVEAIILHELSHIRRNDYLVNILVSVVETILFFNPFAYLLSKSLKKERENCCDDFVLKFQCDPHSYASALLSLEKLRLNSTQYVLAATGENEHQLLGRVKRIMNVHTKSFNYGQKLLALMTIAFILTSLAWLTPAESSTPKGKQEALLEKKFGMQENTPIGAPYIIEKTQTSRENTSNPRRRFRIETVNEGMTTNASDQADLSDVFFDGDGTKEITVSPRTPIFNQEEFSKLEAPGKTFYNLLPTNQPNYKFDTESKYNFSYTFPNPSNNLNFGEWLPENFDFQKIENKSLVLRLQLDKVKKAFEEIDWDKIETEWKQSGQTEDWNDLQQKVKDAFAKQLEQLYWDGNDKRELYTELGRTESKAYRKMRSEYEEKNRVDREAATVYSWYSPAVSSPRARTTTTPPPPKAGTRARTTTPQRIQLLKTLEDAKLDLANLNAAGERKGQPLFFSFKMANQELAPNQVNALNIEAPVLRFTKNHLTTTVTFTTKKKTDCSEVHKSKSGKTVILKKDDPDDESVITISSSKDDDDDNN